MFALQQQGPAIGNQDQRVICPGGTGERQLAFRRRTVTQPEIGFAEQDAGREVPVILLQGILELNKGPPVIFRAKQPQGIFVILIRSIVRRLGACFRQRDEAEQGCGSGRHQQGAESNSHYGFRLFPSFQSGS